MSAQFLLLLFLLPLTFFPTGAHGQSPKEPHILILSAYHPGYRWSDSVLKGVFESIHASNPRARLYVEHLDSKRINSQVALDRLADLIRVKYRNIRIDALIVSDDNSLAFLRKHRQPLLVGIPTVFCGANNVDPQRVKELAPITGVNEAADVKASIEVALKALPDTRRIVVVNDTTITGRNVRKEIAAAATDYEGRVEFTYLEELPFEMLLWQLNELKPGTIVLYSFFFRDSRGRFYEYDESAEAVCKASPVPVFSLWEFNLGHGIVGGKLVSGYTQGSKAGELTLRILEGERPADIPIVMHSPNRLIFDFERIQHFSIDPARLPPESTFINRPESIYETHKAIIWSVLAALVTLTLLSGFLLEAIRRGRRSQAQLKASQDFLAGITSNIPGVVYQFYVTEEGRYGLSYVSGKSTQILGVAPDLETFLDTFAAQIHAADQERFWTSIREAVEKESAWHFEGRFIKATQEEPLWLTGDSIPHREGSRLLFDGVLVDISERKRRVELQRQRLERFQRQQEALLAMGTHTATVDGDVQSAIRFLTETMARALAVKRVGVWMLDGDGAALTLNDGYDTDGKVHTKGEHLKTALYPHYIRAQENDWIIAANDALTDPRTDEFAAGYLRPLGIGALLDAGIFVGGKLMGIICHEHKGAPRAWHSDEISLARSASEFLTRTILRAEHLRAQESLSKAERLWAQVINFLPDPTLAIDQEGRVIVWNRAMAELTGVTASQILGKGDYAYALPIWGDRCPIMVDLVHNWSPEVAAKYTGITRKGGMLSSETKGLQIGAKSYHFRNTAGPLFDDGGNSIGAIETVRDITASKNAEIEQRRRQEFVESVLYHAPDAIITLDADYQVADWNPGAEQAFGYTRDESHGQPLSTLIARGAAVDEMSAKASRIMQGERVEAFETVRYRKDGTPVQVISAGSPIVVDGKFTGAVAMFTDITGLKKAEEEIHQRERMLRLVLDTIPVRVFWKDKESRFVGCNQAFANDAGQPEPEAVVGLDDFALPWTKAQAQRYREDDRAVMNTGEARVNFEEPRTTLDGSQIWLLTSKVPMRDSQNRVIGVLGSYQDVTERKYTEGEVRRLRNYLANIINSMPSALVGVDAQGHITQWNTQAEKLTGLPFDQVSAKPLETAMPLFKDEMARIKKAIRDRQVVHDAKVPSHEAGQTRYQDITIYPLVANGVEGAVIRVDDVTERVRMEEMMIQSEKMLSVGGLAAGMAHEINNPLAGILQNASVMENRLLGDLPANDRAAQAAGTTMEAIGKYMRARKLPEMVGAIRASGDRAASIVRNMLSFARKSKRDITPQEMDRLLDQTIELASTDYDMKKQYDFKHIKIVREYAPHTPAVPCEESKIQQVFLNVLRNGAEAMGSVTEAERAPQFTLRVAEEDRWVRVEIEDNGPGMPEAACKRIFEPFFTTKEVGQGTGLGLSVSYFIVAEDHGGKMAVTSELGGGTCFIIRLKKDRSATVD